MDNCWVKITNEFPHSDDNVYYTEVRYKPTNALMIEYNPDMLEFENFAGDFNGDGGVNVLDIVGIVNYIVFDEYPYGFPYWFENGDVNDDGVINIFDITTIIANLVP